MNPPSMNATTAYAGSPHTMSLRLFCVPDSIPRIGGDGLERELRYFGTRISAPCICGVAAIVATFPGGVMAVFREPFLEYRQ